MSEREAKMTAVRIAWSYSPYLSGRLCERLAEEIEAALLNKWPPLTMPGDRSALIQRAVEADDGACSIMAPAPERSEGDVPPGAQIAPPFPYQQPDVSGGSVSATPTGSPPEGRDRASNSGEAEGAHA